MKKNILTYEGLRALEDELQDLKVNRRREIAQKIKEEQAAIELRIEQIENILKNAEVIVDDDSSAINVGCTVQLKDLDDGKEVEYRLVGSTEANILKGKVSNESPLGKALVGATKGEKIAFEVPAGVKNYEILDFQKN